MGKHTDAVKAYDEFRAPWETEGGTDAEIDKPKLKRYIYNLVTDKAKAQDSRDETLETVKAVEQERDDAKAEAEKASPDEANKKIARLEAENAKLKDEAAARVKADEQKALRDEVLDGLDPKYAKYVQGETREDLEKSLEAVKADFGLTDDGQEEDGDDDEPTVRTTPRTRVRNPADPAPKGGAEQEYDFDKIADGIVGGGVFR